MAQIGRSEIEKSIRAPRREYGGEECASRLGRQADHATAGETRHGAMDHVADIIRLCEIDTFGSFTKLRHERPTPLDGKISLATL
jgi:hypothetical protein